MRLNDPGLCWTSIPDVSLRHAKGPQSTLNGRGDHPVVHVSCIDVVAYADGAGKRRPTEAEWKFAASHAADGNMKIRCGSFPHQYECSNAAPFTVSAVSDAPGLSQMLGNVRRWTSDSIQSESKSGFCAPDVGNQKSLVLKGGSNLCAVS